MTRPACGLVLVCLFLSGCSYEILHYSDKDNGSYSSNSARVAPLPSSGVYRVKQGDTLFSIAFRYGLDYRELAQSNRIASPYVIYPNQKIRLKGAAPSRSNTASTPALIVKETPAVPANTSSAASPVPTRPKAPTAPVATTTKAPEKASIPVHTNEKVPAPIVLGDKMTSDWSWPVNGKVTRSFSNSGVSSKGIDIKGGEGELVKAAADGIVVYAGNGLIGYGNLVIVKHNDVYLSAYAYNDNILVKEKQMVRVGDSLAVIGGKGKERPLLHFEVRRDGQPIDPLSVLPKMQ
ncbi:peptidoglycan DD-metalloendopeptidase family protein [Marinomonas sp. A79]|uniref:Peptidoglycan DD-metalloendopeptidase family protein n=1 Tax=Marinomonas vulgaris TaxID=2823372 RepID=A0ABS5HAD3_9GAMM|nr:peptidoglycan DD-metalloendopeptidase family protein [Marinomonas vulgaris]MBR7888626.1 peptidoglycan DD-metalloendopeptidase family protein [Marinomonas vulgaris]